MDKRTIFIWNGILITSLLVIVFYSYKIYNYNEQKNRLWETYLSDQVGTDEKLQKKVNDLEETYKDRKKFKFKMKKNPVDLSNVINFEGIDFNFGGSGFKAIKLLHITQTENSIPLATVRYKNNYHNLFEGDTLGGGKIVNVTKTEMKYQKDGEIYSFSVKPKSQNNIQLNN